VVVGFLSSSDLYVSFGLSIFGSVSTRKLRRKKEKRERRLQREREIEKEKIGFSVHDDGRKAGKQA